VSDLTSESHRAGSSPDEADDREWKIERIDKLDAVRRQLRTAIRLFFEEKDSVSIYTLASAVVELLRDLLRPSGRGSFLKDSDMIRPEKKREYLEIVNRPQNFFKHADQDPDDVLEFRPETVPFVLLDCVAMYQTLTGRFLREGFLFLMWFAAKYPEFLLPGVVADAAEKVRQIYPAGGPTRAEFLEILGAAHRLGGDFD